MRKPEEIESQVSNDQQRNVDTMEVKRKPRYQHKLNMLEPGIKLCEGIGLMILVALVGGWLHLTWLVTISCVGIGIVVLIFLILLIIEQHQDKMMYLDAKKEDPDVK